MLVFLLLVGAGVSLVFIFRPASPTVVILSLPDGFPPRKPSVLDRWKRVVPLWAWRFKDSIFGPRRSITLDAAIFDFKGSSDATLTSELLGRPEFTGTNGLRVWMLGESDQGALRRRLEQAPGSRLVSAPRVTTAHGIQSQMSVLSRVSIGSAPSSVGIVVDFLPRVRRDSTDLTTIMTGTEAVTNRSATVAGLPPPHTVSIQTNFAFAARIQIPKGTGVFVLQPIQGGTNGRSTGLLISATMQ